MAKINTKIIKVETSVARPIDLQIFRGEKVPIELHFANYGQCLDITGYSVEAYYQSPDMGDSWYKDETAGHLVIDESGEFVTWLWTPDIDAGEDKYKWFVRVYKSGDEDDSYRAFGTIEMLASPAHNQIQPLPVPPIPIDCSKYEWLNAPWYTKEETDEAIADAISEIPVPDYPVTSVNGKTGAVVLSPSDVGAATAAQGAKADRAVLYRTDVTTAVDIGNRNSGTTVGAYSVVEGVGSTATGFSAHAEGASTASGPYSHAEGSSSTAAGYYSHAEGSSTTAAGSHAHAEGENTSATGYASHAEGFYTEAKNHSEHAQGYCNLSHTGNTDAGKTIHSIGVGATIFARSNAVEVMRDGKVFIKGVGSYDGTNPTTSGVKDLATEISGKATQQYVDDTIDNLDASDVGAIPESDRPTFERSHDYTYITGTDNVTKAFDWSGTVTLQMIQNAGYDHDDIKAVVLGNKVTELGLSTFNFQSNLISVDFGEGIQTIGEDAFFNDYRLPSLVFPPSLQSIGQNAFANCNGVTYCLFEQKTEAQVKAMPNYGDWGIVAPLTVASQQWVDNRIDNLDADDVGAVPTGRTINNKSLSQNITLTASDVGALPDSYTAPVTSVNTQSGAVVLDADDVGALPAQHNNAGTIYILPEASIGIWNSDVTALAGALGANTITATQIWNGTQPVGVTTFTLAVPNGQNANDALARTSDLPQTETWTFTLSDNTTVTKQVCVY